MTTIGNAIKALVRFIRALFTGRVVFVPREVKEQRVEVCEVCPNFDEDFRRCRRCRCLVDVKAVLATEACPDGHWKNLGL